MINLSDNVKYDVTVIVQHLEDKPVHAAWLTATLLAGLEAQKKFAEGNLVLKIIKRALLQIEENKRELYVTTLMKVYAEKD